jgi:hypothetical protein
MPYQLNCGMPHTLSKEETEYYNEYIGRNRRYSDSDNYNPHYSSKNRSDRVIISF